MLSNSEQQRRAIIYCRTSTDDSERDSLSHQETDCLKYAESHNYAVIDILKESVRGESGFNMDSPKLRECINRSSEYNVLLIRDTTRLARNYLKAKLTELELEQNDVKIEFVWQSFSGDDSDIMKAISYLFAERERSEISKRMKNGIDHMVEAGSVMFHGNPPYGYSSEKIGKTFVAEIVPAEAEVIKKIFDLYCRENLSLREIARTLDSENIPTYTVLRGSENFNFGNKNSKQWSGNAVREILKNETHAGVWKYRKRSTRKITKIVEGRPVTVTEKIEKPEIIEVEIPAIIDRELFDVAQKKLIENRKRAGRNTKTEYLMSKRLNCGCGQNLVSETRKYRSKKNGLKYYQYYRVRCCYDRWIPAKLIDELAFQFLYDLIQDKEKLQTKLDDYVSELDSQLEPINNRLELLCQMKNKAEKQYSRIMKRWLSMDEFDKKYSTDKNLVRTELEDILSEIEKLETQKYDIELYKIEFQSGWSTASAENWLDAQQTMAEEFLSNDLQEFETRQHWVKKYDIQGNITQDESGQYWIELTCRFGESLWKLLNGSKKSYQKQQNYFIVKEKFLLTV